MVVRRSSRRRQTVAAFWEGGTAVVAIPGHFSAAQEREWVARMLLRLQSKGDRSGKGSPTGRGRSDDALMTRAQELSLQYFAGRSRPVTVRWVSNQNSRWGSATPSERTIRLSHHLQGMPGWVVDYVLLHELAHLLVAGHGPAFWALLEGYPQLERAKAFLEGAAFATSRGLDRIGMDPNGPELD
nr:M48 family metallopeptidase [Paenarthrobacter sp. Z7-10]